MADRPAGLRGGHRLRRLEGPVRRGRSCARCPSCPRTTTSTCGRRPRTSSRRPRTGWGRSRRSTPWTWGAASASCTGTSRRAWRASRAVDIAEGTLKQARARNPGVEYHAVRRRRLDARRRQVDLAFAMGVIHHVPPAGWSGFLRELVRVTRPGGLVAAGGAEPPQPDLPLRGLPVRVRPGRDLPPGAAPAPHDGRRGPASDVQVRYILFVPFRSRGGAPSSAGCDGCRSGRSTSSPGGSQAHHDVLDREQAPHVTEAVEPDPGLRLDRDPLPQRGAGGRRVRRLVPRGPARGRRRGRDRDRRQLDRPLGGDRRGPRGAGPPRSPSAASGRAYIDAAAATCAASGSSWATATSPTTSARSRPSSSSSPRGASSSWAAASRATSSRARCRGSTATSALRSPPGSSTGCTARASATSTAACAP